MYIYFFMHPTFTLICNTLQYIAVLLTKLFCVNMTKKKFYTCIAC